MENIKKFKEMFTVIAERYGKGPSPLLSRMLWDSLKPFDDKQCVKAFNHVFRHGRFWNDLIPDLFEVIEKSGTKQISSNVEIEADKILCHLRQHGSTRWPELKDPITKHLMMNRWPYPTWSRAVLESELIWWKKEFIKAYLAYSNADDQEQIECKNDSVLKLVSCIGE